MTLFEDFQNQKINNNNNKDINLSLTKVPLAERMRPTNLDEFVGQDHLVGIGKILRKAIESDNLFSMIFWGPPGCGKTTLAKIIEKNTKNRFISYSAVVSSIKQIKDVMEIAEYEKVTNKKATVLFIDEIHRFNKAQQDAFLPYVENGTIILIGSTTENPSFEIINALLSRCKVFILNKLSTHDIKNLIKRALINKEKGYGNLNIQIDESVLDFISEVADGDVRFAYNIIEIAIESKLEKHHIESSPETNQDKIILNLDLIEEIIQRKSIFYDKNGEEHYNLISALHKSLRGSDVDASLYWTVRMIEGGEDPLYILRRLVRFASEDIGLADPNALSVAINAKQSFEFVGPPEGYLAILEAVAYLALSPKSNSLYNSYNLIQEDIKKYQSLPVPYHIRNAPTNLLKQIGYSKGYLYPHNFKDAIVNQTYLPKELEDKKYYFPSDRGFEKNLKERIEAILKIKKHKLKEQQ